MPENNSTKSSLHNNDEQTYQSILKTLTMQTGISSWLEYMGILYRTTPDPSKTVPNIITKFSVGLVNFTILNAQKIN